MIRAAVKIGHHGLAGGLAVAGLLALAPMASAQTPEPGWELMAVTGPTNLPVLQSETQQIAVKAANGTFTLSFNGQTTGPIAYNVSDSDLQSALDALSSIGGAGGSVTVTGGPGNAVGSPPYVIAFGGSLANTDVPQLVANSASLTGGLGHTAVVATTVSGGPGTGTIAVYATNVGGAPTSGTSTLTITLPNGISTTSTPTGSGWTCTPAGAGQTTASCTSTTAVAPSANAAVIDVPVVGPGVADSETAQLSVSGGGAANPAAYSEPITISPNPATAGVQAFWAGTFDDQGNPYTQAGGHPYSATTGFLLNTIRTAAGQIAPAGDLKDTNVALPVGFTGNPQATSQCPANQPWGCSNDAIVGVATPLFETWGNSGSQERVYNDVPPTGYPAQFTFTSVTIPLTAVGTVRSDDYGLTVSVPNAPQVYKIFGSFFTFWGAPGDTSHDAQRCQGGNCTLPNPASSDGAFLTNPTDCAAEALSSPVTGLSVDSYQAPSVFSSASYASPPVTGCDQLSFDPSFIFTPSSSSADSPTGATADLSVPNPGLTDPNGLAAPEVQNVTVNLPNGVFVSPAGAQGLQGCSDAEFAVDSGSPNSCPEASKIGTATVTTPLLASPMSGVVYMGSPECSPCSSADAQDGKMVRLFVEVDGDGVTVKLPGTVSVDPTSGRLTATFDQNPQLPFSDLKLQFKGGSTAPLATSPLCGTYTTNSDISPWSSPFTPDATPSSSFQLTSGPNGAACATSESALPFSPSMSAGSTSTTAGGQTDFAFKLTRPDGDQNISKIDTTLPDGLVAKLAGVPLCPDSDTSSGNCKSGSQVGTTTIGVGPGSDPLYVPQAGAPATAVYLAGPYQGAPYSLVINVPAVAGPFNLGNVVVRAGLFVDPTTAQVTVKSDPLPQILDGIPLEYRDVRVNINRSDFMVNPTSCNPMSVTGSITSAQGTVSSLSDRFQVGDCSALGFSPKLKMALTGKGKTKSGDHPALTTTITQPAGQANINSVKVNLPLSLALDPNNSQHVCNYQTAQAVHGGSVNCPANTIVGSATAITPLLSQPLTGPVYLVQGIRTNSQGQQIHTLPTLLVPLRGQVALDLRGQTSVSHGHLVTAFPTVPDAAVSSFKLTINGGKKGILVITGRGRNICGKSQVTQTDLAAQSGKATYPNVRMGTPCRAVRHKQRHGKRAHRTRRSARRVVNAGRR